MTAYYVGDFSDEALIVTPTRGGEDVELHDHTFVVDLVSPAGHPVDPAPTATLVDDEVHVVISTPFTLPGVYKVWVTALRGTTARVSLDAAFIVVEDRNEWHTLHSAREEWRDAPRDDVALHTILTLARDEVEAYARIGASWATIRQGQIMQARTLWNAAKVDASGTLGDGTFQITPRPLDWMVRQVLRPKTAVPKVM